MGWGDVRYCFAMAILVILIILPRVFQFFSILAISMATAAILKKSTFTSTTSHGI
jgi:hypothetical protein